MPDYTKPNLMIPTLLWGEVKVAAFRQGVRPVEIVIECLRKRFGDDYLFKDSVPAKAETKTDSGSVQAVSRVRTGGSTPSTEAKPVVNVVMPSGKYGKPLDDGMVSGVVDYGPIATMKCWMCKEKVTKWTLDVKGHAWCDSCIQDQKNAIA